MMPPTQMLMQPMMAANAAGFGSGGASLGSMLPTGIAGASLGLSIAQPFLAAAAEKRMVEANNRNVQASYRNQIIQLALRQQQEQNKAAQEIDAISRQSLAAKSTASASAVEGGVSGNSVNALMDNYRRRELEFIQRTNRQTMATVYQLDMEKEGVWASSQSRMMSKPSSASALMGAIGGAANVLSNSNFSSALGINWASGVQPARS
jgi:hypothetical protein